MQGRGQDIDLDIAIERERRRRAAQPPKGVKSPEEIAALNAADKAAVTQGDKVGKMFTTAMDAATFGLGGLAQDALGGGDFRANRDLRAAYKADLPWFLSIPAGVAGALVNPVGSVLGPAKAGAGALRTAGKGLLEGAIQGGASAVGENVGRTDGFGEAVGAGVTLGGLLGGTVAGASRKFARRGIDPIAEAAQRRAQDAVDADKALTYTVPVIPKGRGMPEPMEIDLAGPTLTAHARGAAKSVPGRTVATEAFAAREAAMPTAITGDIPDAVKTGERLRAARKAQAEQDFGVAVEATKGRPYISPALDDVRETPTGRAAWLEVQRNRPDLVAGVGDPERALPIVETTVGGAADRPPGFELSGGLMDVPVVRKEAVPDAEAWHEISRQLNRWAKGEQGQVFPEGVSAISAGNALKLLKRLKDEMPPLHQKAIDNYADASRKIDALETGRTPWKANPNPLNKKALPLAEIESDFAKATPTEQALMSQGKRFDIASRVREGALTPAKAAAKLADPQSSLSRELDIAGVPLANRLKAWNVAVERQKNIISGKGDALEPESRDLLSQVSETVAPTFWWSVVRAARHALGKGAERTKMQTGKEDAAFMKMLTSKQGTIKGLLDALALQDEKVGTTAAKASARAGRVGGLLFR